ncbi:hypothetical protein CVT26_007427 [Gymnopilus dilepis]|uniref:Uncharacterized protein n=1 Tax=Gymnopilus dilepis TaxID=231916 RepID=A0A409WTB2_9AGAR|nr:hypothetical protein CVT26_007427 [Gymnopilus dilepis]
MGHRAATEAFGVCTEDVRLAISSREEREVSEKGVGGPLAAAPEAPGRSPSIPARPAPSKTESNATSTSLARAKDRPSTLGARRHPRRDAPSLAKVRVPPAGGYGPHDALEGSGRGWCGHGKGCRLRAPRCRSRGTRTVHNRPSTSSICQQLIQARQQRASTGRSRGREVRLDYELRGHSRAQGSSQGGAACSGGGVRGQCAPPLTFPGRVEDARRPQDVGGLSESTWVLKGGVCLEWAKARSCAVDGARRRCFGANGGRVRAAEACGSVSNICFGRRRIESRESTSMPRTSPVRPPPRRPEAAISKLQLGQRLHHVKWKVLVGEERYCRGVGCSGESGWLVTTARGYRWDVKDLGAAPVGSRRGVLHRRAGGDTVLFAVDRRIEGPPGRGRQAVVVDVAHQLEYEQINAVERRGGENVRRGGGEERK